jgi:MFS family permease
MSFLSNRFLRVILFSGFFSQLGVWTRNIAVLFYVIDETKSDPFAISMISVAEFAPIFLFSFIGGTLADRFRAKRIMVWSDILSSITIVVVFLFIQYGEWKSIFLATLISAILSQFTLPASMRLFKMYVPEEQRQAGMSILQTLMSLFMVLGPAIGAVVYQQLGMNLSLTLTIVSFLFSAVTLFFLPSDKINENMPQSKGIGSDMKLAMTYVFKSKQLLLLGSCFLLVGLGVGLTQPLGIFLITEKLGLTKSFYQWSMIVYGAGEILGGLLLAMIASKWTPQKFLTSGLLVNGIGIALSGLSSNVWLTLFSLFCIALTQPFIFIGVNTMILKLSPMEMVGRINGLLTPLLTGSMVITMSLSGVMKSWIPLESIYATSGLLFLMSFAFVIPLFRLPIEQK